MYGFRFDEGVGLAWPLKVRSPVCLCNLAVAVSNGTVDLFMMPPWSSPCMSAACAGAVAESIRHASDLSKREPVVSCSLPVVVQ